MFLMLLQAEIERQQMARGNSLQPSFQEPREAHLITPSG